MQTLNGPLEGGTWHKAGSCLALTTKYVQYVRPKKLS